MEENSKNYTILWSKHMITFNAHIVDPYKYTFLDSLHYRDAKSMKNNIIIQGG